MSKALHNVIATPVVLFVRIPVWIVYLASGKIESMAEWTLDNTIAWRR